MDRGAWWAAVHGVTKSHTRLSDLTNKSDENMLENMFAFTEKRSWFPFQQSSCIIDSLWILTFQNTKKNSLLKLFPHPIFPSPSRVKT